VPVLQLLQSFAALLLLPGFWRFYADPPYMYLFNSLSLGTGLTPQHVDHPGTSLQWLMAGIEHGTYWIAGSQESLPTDVAFQPELYLTMTGVVLAVLFGASCAYFGVAVVRSFGSVPGVVAGAVILAGSGLTVPWIVTATPEALVATCAMLIVAALAPTVKDRSEQPSWARLSLIAVIFAVAVTAKITVLPLAVLFLFVLSWRKVVGGVAVAGFTSALILLPVFALLPRMFGWFTNLARSTGRYGGESPTSLSTNVVTGLQTVTSEYILTWIVLIALGVALVVNVRLNKGPSTVLPILGVGATIAATLAVSFKESTDRDFIILIALVPLGAALSLSRLSDAWSLGSDDGRKRASLIGKLSLGVVLVFVLVGNANSFGELREIRSQSEREVAAMEVASDVDGTVVHSFLARNEFYPLMLGSEWAYHPYSDRILQRFPGNLYFNPFLSTVFGTKADGSVGYLDCRDLGPLADSGQLTFVLPGDHSTGGPLETTEIVLQDGSVLGVDQARVRVIADSLSTMPISGCKAST